MARIQLEGLSKRFGTVTALDNLTLEVREGEFFTLLGPSGCGKTTTLRLIAGLEVPTAGRILIDGRDVTHVPANRRNVGMVFQNYALFPHLNVFENVAFGLRARGLPKSVVDERVRKALRLVHLAHLETRKPSQLSGGQQQRVALARALAIQPSILLLDEPLSNLDAKLREETRAELQRLQKSSGITTVYVTHDQSEAFALSDRVAIMNAGRCEQVGTPAEIYLRPATAFVARFIGQLNVLPATVLEVADGVVIIDAGFARLSAVVNGKWDAGRPLRPGVGVVACFHPESIELAELPDVGRTGNEAGVVTDAPGVANTFPAEVDLVQFNGVTTLVRLRSGEQTLSAIALSRSPLASLGRGQRVKLRVAPENVLLLPVPEEAREAATGDG